MPRIGSTCFSSRILGGLPVDVEANIYPSDPDVGIFHEQVEITGIFWPWRKGDKKARPIPEQMWERITSDEQETLQREALGSGE